MYKYKEGTDPSPKLSLAVDTAQLLGTIHSI